MFAVMEAVTLCLLEDIQSVVILEYVVVMAMNGVEIALINNNILNSVKMRKVSFMKLNIQQENVLSKEEKKKVLGGGGGGGCYVTCSGGVTEGMGDCDNGPNYPYSCGYGKYCMCNGNLVWGSM